MELLECDLLCIGGGAAGAAAAITAAQSGLKVIVVDKNFISYGNTRIAGGIIASQNPDAGDSEALFCRDIRKAGAFLNDPELVKVLSRDLPGAIDTVENWGHHFLREPGGRQYIKVSGHSKARTLLSPHQGRSLSHILKLGLLHSDVTLLEETLVVKLVVHEGVAAGALCLKPRDHKFFGIRAAKTIIACGGAGMLFFPFTDNMNGTTGDGYALALEAGARLVDMELFQYLPFALAHPRDMTGIAIGDPANAGPFGLLLDGEGQVVAEEIHQRTRNEVSRMIAETAKKGKGGPHGGVFLDLRRNRGREEGEKSFAVAREIGMYDILAKAYGKEAAEWREPFEVCPTVHFTLGGIQVDTEGQSSVENLYAVGEAAGGIHGADRLGSVALAECLVFGIRAARHACATLHQSFGRHSFYSSLLHESQEYQPGSYSRKIHPFFLKTRLTKIMNDKVGIFRNEGELLEAHGQIKELSQIHMHTGYDLTSAMPVLHAVELGFMLATAEAVILCALARRASVGMHNRTDFPSPETGMEKKNMVIRKVSPGSLQVNEQERAGEPVAG